MKSHPLRGVLLTAAAVLLFACLDACNKYLTARYRVSLLAFDRYLVQSLLMLCLLWRSEGMGLLRARRPLLVTIRALCLAGLTMFQMLALARMPVAEATAISFVTPLLVVLLARPLLGEKIGLFRWGAVIAGFVGVLLVANPGGDVDPLGVTYVLCGALCGTGYQLLSRSLASTESTSTMLFYTGLAGIVFFLPGVVLAPMPPNPGLLDGVLLLCVGALGGVGHYLFTRAYKFASASLIAPFSYLQLLWAGILGWLVFNRVPHHFALFGMLIIGGSGVAVAWHQQRNAAARRV